MAPSLATLLSEMQAWQDLRQDPAVRAAGPELLDVVSNSLAGGGGGGSGSLPSGFATETTLQEVLTELQDRLMSDGTQFGTTSAINGNLKASAGSVLAVMAQATSAPTAVTYLQFFDATSSPSNGATPFKGLVFPIYPFSNGAPSFLALGQDLFGGNGVTFPTGISWGLSSTPLTYTAVASGSAILNIRYK